jgi:hypothetical protein
LLCRNGLERKPQFLQLLHANPLLRNVLPLLTFVGPQRARHTNLQFDFCFNHSVDSIYLVSVLEDKMLRRSCHRPASWSHACIYNWVTETKTLVTSMVCVKFSQKE